jgi:hypothetical protein
MNREKDKIPSNKLTLLLREIEAKQDPRATVTTKSNAFIFDNVLFPDILRIITMERYPKTVRIMVLDVRSQPEKKIFSIF